MRSTRPHPRGSGAAHEIAMSEQARSFMRKGWEPTPRSAATISIAEAFARRRRSLSHALPGHLIVVPSGAQSRRSNDMYFRFRAHSSFVYLTGCDVAGAVLVMLPNAEGHSSILFSESQAEPGDPRYFSDRQRGALWVGASPTREDLSESLNLEVREIDDLARTLGRLRSTRTYALLEVDLGIDQMVPRAERLDPIVDALRLIKDSEELEQLRFACESTVRGFEDVVNALPQVRDVPGVAGERWLEGTFERRARLEGSEPGYPPIVAAGDHATTLHWWRNTGAIESGQLLLLDMGVETLGHYTADITRTIPVSGEWSDTQLRVYRAVLEARQSAEAEVRGGATFMAAHEAATWVLCEHLYHWGVLPVTPADSCSQDKERPGAGTHRRYTLHNTSHMLGLDVHDCASAHSEFYVDATLEPGHVMTIEPGLYFQANDATVPGDLRGLATRIEDDLIVTERGSINLSAALPTDPKEVSDWMRRCHDMVPSIG